MSIQVLCEKENRVIVLIEDERVSVIVEVDRDELIDLMKQYSSLEVQCSEVNPGQM